MSKMQSERRLAENEVFFRQRNLSIEENFSAIKKIAEEDNQSSMVDDDDMVLQFYCECSDADCAKRIPLKRSEYDSIHKANDLFVVVPGHDNETVERIVRTTKTYAVVQKHIQPPTTATHLNPN